MVITDFLERNARLYGGETALVEINPSEERDQAVTWRDFSLIESANPDAPYRRALSWKDFDRRANRIANLLLSRGLERGTKVGILLMNCLEWLPLYFGILKAGCVAVPMNFRYSSEEIKYCLELADVEVLVFGPEFVERMDAIAGDLPGVRMMFFIGPDMTMPPFTSRPAPLVFPRPSSTTTVPWWPPAKPNRITTGRPARTCSSASRPCTTPAPRCTGSAA